MAAISAEELRASIERHNSTFEALLNLIPPKFYISKEPDEAEISSKYMKNKRKRDAPKQAIKEASKKAKLAKLDPDNQKTVLDLQREAAARKQTSSSSSKAKGKAPQSDDDDDEDDSPDENEDSDGAEAMDLDDGAGGPPLRTHAPVPMQKSGSITELRARLHARMDALRRGRGGLPDHFEYHNQGAGDSGEPESKDALLEERRLKRAGLREKRRQGMKERKKEEAAKHAKKDKSTKVNKVELVVPEPGPSKNSKHDTLANITFSKLASTPSHTTNKKIKTSSDPHTALAQLEARAARLALLPAEKRAEIEEKDRLAKAEIRASGGKVYDDVSRLKKAVKRKDSEKSKSKKGWEDRKEQLVKSQAAKQKKRTDNIAMRHERLKDKRKGIKPAKAAKARPGFEGKSFKKPQHASKSRHSAGGASGGGGGGGSDKRK